MKTFAHYTVTSILFISVFFFLIFMNLVSFLMLRKIGKHEEKTVGDTYFFAGYELARF